MSAPKCNPEIWNKNLTTIRKGHDIGLKNIQMLSVKYTVTESCDKVMDRKLKSLLWKEIMTALIVTLALLGLILSKLNQFRRDYLKSRLPEKIRPLAKNVPVKSEWLFGDDLNKRINTISSTNAARTASICPNCKYENYQGSKTVSNQQHYGSKNSQTSRRGSAQGKRWPKKQNNSFHRN